MNVQYEAESVDREQLYARLKDIAPPLADLYRGALVQGGLTQASVPTRYDVAGYWPYGVDSANPTVVADTGPYVFGPILTGAGFIAYPINPSGLGWPQEAEVTLSVEPAPGAGELDLAISRGFLYLAATS